MSDEPGRQLDEGALRVLVPRVLASLIRRGEDFDAAEDALQDALLEALRVWPEHPPRDPRACLTTVATRRAPPPRRAPRARGSPPPRRGASSTPAGARSPAPAARSRRTRSRGRPPPR